MSEYNKEQSIVIALWVLALQNRHDPKAAVQGHTAPNSIYGIVNKLGEHHSSDSMLLHAHGYDRLLLDRKIDRSVTKLQKEVAAELKVQGIISTIYTI